jgi:CBS domain-containing protein
MARAETLPTLPEWGQDEVLDGWRRDTEPGNPPDALPEPVTIAVPLMELVRAAQLVEASAPLCEVASAAWRGDGDPVIVVDSGTPLGVLRPADVVRALISSDDVHELTAADLMSTSVYCLKVEAGADRALELLTTRGAREVVVIDGFGSLIGIVVPEDVMRALARTRPAKSSA